MSHDSIPFSIKSIDAISISYEVQALSKEDLVIIEQVFRHPSVVRYLKFLEADILNDYHKIPLEQAISNIQEFMCKTAFVKGTVNVTQTLLQIHKSTPANPTNVPQT